MRRRVSERWGSRHVLQSMRAHTAALNKVAADSAICTQAMTTKSRDDGLESSSTGIALEKMIRLDEVLSNAGRGTNKIS